MTVKVITPPTQQITTAELKLHCHVTNTEEEALIGTYYEAARAYAETYSGRSVGSQTLELALDAFPASAIELPNGPVSSIASVIYTTVAKQDQTIDSALYFLDNYGQQHWVMPVDGATWPISAAVVNAVKVRYVAGDFPDAVKAAMLLYVGHLFANREAVSVGSLQEIPMGVKSLLDTCRIRLGMA